MDGKSGEITRNAGLELEKKINKQVLSPQNAKDGIMLKGNEEKEDK